MIVIEIDDAVDVVVEVVAKNVELAVTEIVNV